MTDPRVFFLGGKLSQEIPREHWEQRRQDYDDPRYRELATEIAPGVFVRLLGHGDSILPGTYEADGRTYPNVGSGAEIAVWAEVASGDDDPAAPLPDGARDKVAEALHDSDCGCGSTTEACGRWKAGIDPESRWHSTHAGHVEYYRDIALQLLAAATPALKEAFAADLTSQFQRVLADNRRAVRAELAAVYSPAEFRELAGWFDDDDALKMTLAADPLMIVPPTWRDRSNELQKVLRQFADLLDGEKP